MRRTWKRTLGAYLLALCLGLLPAAAWAAEDEFVSDGGSGESSGDLDNVQPERVFTW